MSVPRAPPWDKKTYAHHPPDPVTGANYDKAVRHKWMWHQTVAYRPIGVISSVKKPLESRVWYNYPDQVLGTYGIYIGSSESPSRIGRRTDSGQSQVTLYVEPVRDWLFILDPCRPWS